MVQLSLKLLIHQLFICKTQIMVSLLKTGFSSSQANSQNIGIKNSFTNQKKALKLQSLILHTLYASITNLTNYFLE